VIIPGPAQRPHGETVISHGPQSVEKFFTDERFVAKYEKSLRAPDVKMIDVGAQA